jgi:hypothetical protein
VTPAITIREAVPGDAPRLRALSALDSRRPLSGRALVAEVDGEPRAAASVDGSVLVADPFFRSLEVAELLRLRISQLGREVLEP